MGFIYIIYFRIKCENSFKFQFDIVSKIDIKSKINLRSFYQ